LENRYFLSTPRAAANSANNRREHTPIFKVNLHQISESQIRRCLTARCQGEPSTHRIGVFQPGDTLDYVTNRFHVTLGNFSPPGPQFSFDVGTRLRITIGSDPRGALMPHGERTR
jgi:hypothetical protein